MEGLNAAMGRTIPALSASPLNTTEPDSERQRSNDRSSLQPIFQTVLTLSAIYAAYVIFIRGQTATTLNEVGRLLAAEREKIRTARASGSHDAEAQHVLETRLDLVEQLRRETLGARLLGEAPIKQLSEFVAKESAEWTHGLQEAVALLSRAQLSRVFAGIALYATVATALAALAAVISPPLQSEGLLVVLGFGCLRAGYQLLWFTSKI